MEHTNPFLNHHLFEKYTGQVVNYDTYHDRYTPRDMSNQTTQMPASIPMSLPTHPHSLHMNSHMVNHECNNQYDMYAKRRRMENDHQIHENPYNMTHKDSTTMNTMGNPADYMMQNHTMMTPSPTLALLLQPPTVYPMSQSLPTTLASTSNESTAQTSTCQYHILQPLRSLPQYSMKKNTQNRAKRRCKVCGVHCSFYCEKCSDLNTGKIVSICNPFSIIRKPCYFQHVESSTEKG